MEPRYVFHHIPKTGGNSVRETFAQWFNLVRHYRPGWGMVRMPRFDLEGLDSASMLCGHFEVEGNRLRGDYGDVFSNPGYRVITFVRDPLEIAVSLHFFESRHQSGNEGWEPGTLEERVLRRAPNFMARMMQCDESNWQAVVDAYWFVGVTEDLQRSCDALAWRLGKPRVAVGRKNVTTRERELDPEVFGEFFQRNTLDYKIYHYCLLRHAAELRRMTDGGRGLSDARRVCGHDPRSPLDNRGEAGLQNQERKTAS